ncbi:MAG: dihydropteroate synthase [Mucispirillum sp.]|nr:dihydropteroate synthase [Mucispirillum sp.]
MKFYKLTPDTDRIKRELERIGVDSYALKMADKGTALNILARDVKPPAANIIKQEAIASGMDAAVKRGTVSCSIEKTDVLLMGSPAAFKRLIKRLRLQVFGLKELADDLDLFLKNREAGYISAGDKKISLDKTLVMGILNVTPDSFSDGGKYYTDKDAGNHIDRMVSEGADIIDIGGMSSRPGSCGIESSQEIKRIKFAVEYAVERGVIVSVDTNNYETAEYALNKGVHIINDISGMRDVNMIKVCADAKCAVCIMHMRGEPLNMQYDTVYDNIIYDIYDFFGERTEACLNAGLDCSNLILDVGFGFGKSVRQNYALLKYMREYKSFNLPLLAGISNKSMIGVATFREVEDRAAGTSAANAAAIMNGADIIRVHDVKAGVDTARTVDMMMKAGAEC